VIKRSKLDVDEVSCCLQLALSDAVFDNKAFHRHESGELKPRRIRENHGSLHHSTRQNATVSSPMKITNDTKANLGKVHYHLAFLHGMERFPEVVPQQEFKSAEDAPSHDVFSVIFHLSHAASLYSVPACLALARARVGLDSSVSNLLKGNVPIDFDSSKDLCRRAMASMYPPAAPKVAAGCLLYQILDDEGSAGTVEKIHILEETLRFMDASLRESEELKEHAKKQFRGKAAGFFVGDKVEGNYFMEGTFYPGIVVEVMDNGNSVVVQYDDDGSTEPLTVDNVKAITPPTEYQTEQHGPLSDVEALGKANSDEVYLFEQYELKARLADLKAKTGDSTTAASLFQQAAEMAMSAGKMQTANKWSMRAAELEC